MAKRLLTDEQVEALRPNGNLPRSVPPKRMRSGTRAVPRYEPERRIRGSRGGSVHGRSDADAAHTMEACGLLR